MLRILIGTFLILHGLVHLLYFGQSWRLFELQPRLVWPDNSWAFSKLLGDETARLLASLMLALVALMFVAGGTGVFLGQNWWRSMAIWSAVFSTLIYIFFWNGKLQQLDDQGWIGILINFVVLVALLVAQWPDFDF